MIGTSTLLTGGRMIVEAIRWMIHSRQGPWSDVLMSADLRGHIPPWYSVRIFCNPQKPFAVELLSVRTIRPKGLLLCRATPEAAVGMKAGTEAQVLRDLNWTITEAGRIGTPFERFLFVKLDGLKGAVAIDLEFEARYYDNRRTKASPRVRTNTLKL